MRTLQILLILFCLNLNAQHNDLDIEMAKFQSSSASRAEKPSSENESQTV